MEADAEHQEDDADFGEFAWRGAGSALKPGVGADHYAGEEVADQRPNAQPPGN